MKKHNYQNLGLQTALISTLIMASCSSNKSDLSPGAAGTQKVPEQNNNINNFISQPAPPYGIKLGYNSDLISENTLMTYLKLDMQSGHNVKGEVSAFDPMRLLITPFVSKESNLPQLVETNDLLSIGCSSKDVRPFVADKKVVPVNLTHGLPDDLAEKFKDLYDPSNSESLDSSTQELIEIALNRSDVSKISRYKADTIVICNPWAKVFLDRTNINLIANTTVFMSAQIKPGYPKFGTKEENWPIEFDYNFKLDTKKLVLIGESTIEVTNFETQNSDNKSIFYSIQLKFDSIEGDGFLRLKSKGVDAATYEKKIINSEFKK